MRKFRRAIARYNMERKGYTQINKKKGGHSFFFEHWRDFVR